MGRHPSGRDIDVFRIGKKEFQQTWAVDFEFTAPPGERPTPICMVARELVSGKTIRHLVFSSADLSAKIKGCAKISCTDSDLNEGMTVDLDAGPRLNYWVVGDGQRVQYSGTAKQETLQLTTDTAQRIAGKLTIDDGGSGGAKASVDFDATMMKAFEK